MWKGSINIRMWRFFLDDILLQCRFGIRARNATEFAHRSVLLCIRVVA